MKKTKKILGLTACALLISTMFQAQAQNVSNNKIASPVAVNNVGSNTKLNNTLATTNTSPIGVATLAETNSTQPSVGNFYEKETTPLLRRISRKKAELEEKKLDLEIEKTETETLKSQQIRTNPAKADGDKSKLINVSDISNPPLQAAPVFTQPQQSLPTVKKSKKKTEEETAMMDEMMQQQSEVKVLMTYGFDDNLFAKITNGTQGGYVVKRGDILPDGREVARVTPNFVEVKSFSGKSKNQKIFVTGQIVASPDGKPATPAPTNSSGNAGSANILPLLGPMSSAPMTTSQGTISFPNGPRENVDLSLPKR